MTIFQPANEHLGYCFHPSDDEQTIGHPQLDVVIRPAPTEEHFDPESFTCLVPTPNGAGRLHVVHPWNLDHNYRVCAGDALIEDRLHERLQAFTFGGTLSIESDQRRTIIRLASPAPILAHSIQPLTFDEWLIEEVHILCAERRATQDDDVFERRLAAADPLLLYRACLNALRDKFAGLPDTDDLHRHFKHLLHSIRLPAVAAATTPTLADLL
jgi:hypothetical protein